MRHKGKCKQMSTVMKWHNGGLGSSGVQPSYGLWDETPRVWFTQLNVRYWELLGGNLTRMQSAFPVFEIQAQMCVCVWDVCTLEVP